MPALKMVRFEDSSPRMRITREHPPRPLSEEYVIDRMLSSALKAAEEENIPLGEETDKLLTTAKNKPEPLKPTVN